MIYKKSVNRRVSLDTRIKKEKKISSHPNRSHQTIRSRFQRGEKEGEPLRWWYRLIEGAQSLDNELQSPVTRNTEK